MPLVAVALATAVAFAAIPETFAVEEAPMRYVCTAVGRATNQSGVMLALNSWATVRVCDWNSIDQATYGCDDARYCCRVGDSNGEQGRGESSFEDRLGTDVSQCAEQSRYDPVAYLDVTGIDCRCG